ncbi:hypothetical protein ACH5RR_018995 [Cinchona calisaya]|uniref:Uncharacterized protein n=1 Tax=Cinchona calisaya TaxID=153742 RepID=A0ABD2ZN61_9GENT
MEVPVECPWLCRLPTIFQLEATAKVNYLSSNSALSSANSYPEAAPERFPYSPYVEPRSSAFDGDQHLTSSSSTLFLDSKSEGHRQAPPFTQGASGIHILRHYQFQRSDQAFLHPGMS